MNPRAYGAQSFSGFGVPGVRGAGRSGFTLPELLVVIGLVLVLVALGVQGFRESREAALEMGCRGNMRELVALLNAYRGDHDQRLPPETAHSSDFYGLIPIYLSGHTGASLNLNSYQDPSGIRFCTRLASEQERRDFVANHSVTWPAYSYSIPMPLRRVHPTLVTMTAPPDRVFLLAENAYSDASAESHYSNSTNPAFWGMGHRGGLNVVMADFSVRKIPYPPQHNWNFHSYHRVARPEGYLFGAVSILNWERDHIRAHPGL